MEPNKKNRVSEKLSSLKMHPLVYQLIRKIPPAFFTIFYKKLQDLLPLEKTPYNPFVISPAN